jgi:hypothetical protein
MRRRTPRDIYHEVKYHAIEVAALSYFCHGLLRKSSTNSNRRVPLSTGRHLRFHADFTN